MQSDPWFTRNRRAVADWLRRMADHAEGKMFPDPRDQELRDRGWELRWRFGVIRRERRATDQTIIYLQGRQQ